MQKFIELSEFIAEIQPKQFIILISYPVEGHFTIIDITGEVLILGL